MVRRRRMKHLRFTGLAVLALSAGCTGNVIVPGSSQVEPGDQGSNPGPSQDPYTDRGPGLDPGPPPEITPDLPPAAAMSSTLRRVSPEQYANLVNDLFGGRIAPGVFDVATPELANSGFSTDAEANRTNSAAVGQLHVAAEAAAVQSVSEMGSLLPCANDGGNEACVDEFVDRYVSRAFRRPVLAAEREAFRADFQAARSAGFSVVESFAVLVQTLLQSAPVLYVAEVGGAPENGRRELTQFEIASRLSFMYRDSIPDDELWQAAVDGRLRDKAVLAAQARRLIRAYPRRFLRRFTREWLHLSEYLDKERDTFPDFGPALASAFEEELVLLMERATTGSEPFSESVLTAREIPINERLAEHYGISDFNPGPDGWAWVEMPQRFQGLFTRPYFLASHSGVRDTSHVHRGLTVMTQLLCAPPGAPPPNADTEEPEYPPQASARQRSEILREAMPTCAACHDQIDGIGLALENYDAIGQFRDRTPSYEGSQPVDTSGTFARLGRLSLTDLAGQDFDGAQGLAAALAGSEDVSTCLVRQWFRYATHHRETTDEDIRLVSEMRNYFVDNGRTLEALFVSATQSDAFIHREATP